MRNKNIKVVANNILAQVDMLERIAVIIDKNLTDMLSACGIYRQRMSTIDSDKLFKALYSNPEFRNNETLLSIVDDMTAMKKELAIKIKPILNKTKNFFKSKGFNVIT